MTEHKLVIDQEVDGTYTVTEVSRLRISNHATIKEAREELARIKTNDEMRAR